MDSETHPTLNPTHQPELTTSHDLNSNPHQLNSSPTFSKTSLKSPHQPQEPPSSRAWVEPVTTRLELWSYYLFYNDGVGPMGYSLTLFQSLITSAGFDSIKGLGSKCDLNLQPESECVIHFGSSIKSVESVVLVANGLAFALMTMILTTFGGAADYGQFGRHMLLILTLICWISQYATLALKDEPENWRYAMMIYISSFVTYGSTLVFYAAAFPRLARHTPTSLRSIHSNPSLSKPQLDLILSLEANRISNLSTLHSNLGYLFISLLNLSLLIPLAGHPHLDTYTIVFTNSYWVALGIWWFIFQEHRPGPPLPPKSSYLTIGWINLIKAIRQSKTLPITFLYLISFFFLADGLNTTGTLISIVQAAQIEFSFLDSTYLAITQALTSIISTASFYMIQKRFKLPTKTMFIITNLFTIMIPTWGMMGLWTTKIGFHNRWEFWLYNVIFGLFQAPYYAYSQTIMAELTPPGSENLFFALFGFSNRASSIIGPNVVQAIIDKAHSTHSGFPFLVAICTLASLVIWFGVDVKQGKSDAMGWTDQAHPPPTLQSTKSNSD